MARRAGRRQGRHAVEPHGQCGGTNTREKAKERQRAKEIERDKESAEERELLVKEENEEGFSSC